MKKQKIGKKKSTTPKNNVRWHGQRETQNDEILGCWSNKGDLVNCWPLNAQHRDPNTPKAQNKSGCPSQNNIRLETPHAYAWNTMNMCIV